MFQHLFSRECWHRQRRPTFRRILEERSRQRETRSEFHRRHPDLPGTGDQDSQVHAGVKIRRFQDHVD